MVQAVSGFGRLRLVESKHDPKAAWLEEADIEFMAFCDEVARSMDRLVQAEMAQDIPSGYVVNEAERIRHKAMKARAECRRLREG